MMKNVLLPVIFFFREWWDIGNFLFLKKWFANWEDDQAYVTTDTILN